MTILKVILLLIAIESGGDTDAVGDNGRAIGWLQIHPILVADVNRISNTNIYSLEDRRDPIKSVEMAVIYLRHYGSASRLGHQPTVQDLLLIWNGGPNFYKYPNAPDAQRYLRILDPHMTRMSINPLERVNAMSLTTTDYTYLKGMF